MKRRQKRATAIILHEFAIQFDRHLHSAAAVAMAAASVRHNQNLCVELQAS